MDGAKIVEGVFFINGFTSAGEIRMIGSEIGGKLSCNGAYLTSTRGTLYLNGARIEGSIFLNYDFESVGEISLRGAQIVGDLICIAASIKSLDGQNMEVKGDFLWQEMKNPERALLNLMGAKIKVIRDDHASWPVKGNLRLDGFSVQDLEPFQVRKLDTFTGRIAWLNRQPNFQLAEPQPWMHLASLLEAKGYKRAAKRVIFELRRNQYRDDWKNRRLKLLGYPLVLAFARLEEQPFRILFPILIFAALSSATFHRYRVHFAETSEPAYKATHTPNPQAVAAYPKFQPFVYALENVLPVIKLGQDDKWAPDPAHTGPWVYRGLVWLRWILILAGWFMGGILAAAVSARFRN